MSAKSLENLRMRIRVIDQIEEDIPKFEIRHKNKSFLMKLLSVVLFFNRKFMTNYVTTMYPVVYVPDWWGINKARQKAEIEILAHEYVHLYDRKKMWWLFNLLYLSPQIFSLLAIGAFWNISFLWCLLFLLPWPSPGRAWLEFRGYRMSLAMMYWMRIKGKLENVDKRCTFIENYDITWVVGQFTGPAYYFMFPFKDYLGKKFRQTLEDIKDDNLSPELLKMKDRILKS